MSEKEMRGSERAMLETRRALLEHLRVPLGQAVIMKRRSPEGDLLVVRLAPSAQPTSRPTYFEGHRVIYEPLFPAKAGHW
jgi:hypothetical protein